MASTREPIVLASASPTRAAILTAAGIDFTVQPADVDEASVKRAARKSGRSASDCALQLAEEKAMQVAQSRPDALVIGADQILVCGDKWFDKPVDPAAAREQLRSLRGSSHELATAVCVVRQGDRLWHLESAPRLTMRRFSDAFLDAYLTAEGDAVLGSVGAYRLEGRGIQLFSQVEGDHFAILGLPVCELLGFLRDRGALCS
jgi:septum formation protein